MSTDAQCMMLEPASELEDAAFREIFPWRCYRDGMQTSHDFKNLDEASAATGISVRDIEYAMEFQKGSMGGFVFVKS